MSETQKTRILVCSCEDTMSLDGAAIRKGCAGAEITTARHLCGPEMGRFKAAAQAGTVLVACTQEAQRFREAAEDERLGARLAFANVRETAGWSAEGKAAGPKMAALLAAALIEDPAPAGVSFESEGVTLILGRDETALEAARRLEGNLDITVLLSGSANVTPPSVVTFPIRKGRATRATGHLGAFEIVVDGYAAPSPSSRDKLVFGPARDGAVSKADIVIDLTGGAPLFPAPDLRDGYLRADPADPRAVEALLREAANLVGTFDKPRYIEFRADLCAHSRSRITGCRRCLDLCPAGAITPAGDTVAIDPYVCGGCGACAAACPTGAAAYAVPAADVVMQRLRALLTAYRTAGGAAPVVLMHDGDHGRALIEAAARFGAGLPAHVLPLSVNEVTQVGLETLAAAFAYGATGVTLLTRAKPRHGTEGLDATVRTADVLLGALGYGEARIAVLSTDDPDALSAAFPPRAAGRPAPPSDFLPLGGKRDVLKLALRELNRVAPSPKDVVALPAGAAFGRITVDTKGCTLCLSCVASCPAGALSDNADRPMLRFDESLCVQCGLCAATCPEKVIALEPRLDFTAFDRGAVVLNEEEPFCCTNCGTAFGVRSTIEKVKARLAGSHWMFSGEGQSRLALLELCDTCRIEAATNASIDPYGAPPRPPARTTDDYFREREETARREAEMLAKIERGDA